MMLRVIISLTKALLEDWLLFTLFLNDCDSSAGGLKCARVRRKRLKKHAGNFPQSTSMECLA